MTEHRLASNAIASIGQVAFSAISLMLTYRVMMDYLSISQIGLWSLVMGAATLAGLSEFGLGGGVLRFVAKDLHEKKTDSAAQTIGMAFIVIGLLLTTSVLLLYSVVQTYLLSTVNLSDQSTIKALLPVAAAVVVVGPLSNVFVNSLDGCQRIDIRCAIQAVGSLVQLGVTCVVLPKMGVDGLGLAQLAQASTILLGSSIATFVLIQAPLLSYVSFSYSRLKEMLKYGGALQLSGLAQMLFDPLIKVLLARYGSVALTGYYDMANRVLQQFRSLIIAGFTALVPHVAARSQDGSTEYAAETRDLYVSSMRLLTFLLIPYYTLIASALPLGLTMWKGEFDPLFLGVAIALHVGWFINTLNPPSYLIYIALGRLIWPVSSHIIIGVLTLVLGVLLGVLFGGYGVVAAMIISLSVGSSSVVLAFHKEYNVHLSSFVSKDLIGATFLLLASVAATAAMALGYLPCRTMWLMAYPLGVAVLLGWSLHRSPMSIELAYKVQAFRLRRNV